MGLNRAQYSWRTTFGSVFECTRLLSSLAISSTHGIGLSDLHNETGASFNNLSLKLDPSNTFSYAVNIHSHLWPAVAFLVMAGTLNIVFRSHYELAKRSDLAFMTLYLLSAFFCHGASALFHAIRCHSEKVFHPNDPPVRLEHL